MEKTDFTTVEMAEAENSSCHNIEDYIRKIKIYHNALSKKFFNSLDSNELDKIYRILDKQGIIQLQLNDSFEVIVNKFLTKLCYMAYRHDANSEKYKTVKSYINILQPKFVTFSIEQLRNYLKKQEQLHGDYFGSYLSDDSDSEEFSEENISHDNRTDFINRDELCVPINQLENAGKYLEQNLTKLLKQDNLLKRENIACLPSLKERQSLHYKGEQFEQAKVELEKLNTRLKQGESINQILPTLKFQFFVGQYRGITYFLNRWNQTARQNHRNKNEKFEHYYSEAVYLAAGYENLYDFYHQETHSSDQQIKLFSKAHTLKGKLVNLKTAKNCIYKNKKYANYRDLLKEIYTNGYQAFKELVTKDKTLKKLLPKGGNPFVSTADTPNHSLHYAYALKAYANQKTQITSSRWNKSGKAERPYAGKCCVFLIPLNMFDSVDYPSHLVSKNWNAEVEIPDYIVAERETSFDAYVDKNNVIIEHVARYPSFDKLYKNNFLIKYGMDEKLYSLFQNAIKTTKRHTQEWKNLKILIGEWLCYVHEIRLIKQVQAYAKHKGGFIVYHDNQHNQFSFQLPLYTPRGSYTAITPEQKKSFETKVKESKSNIYYSRITYRGGSSNNNQVNNPNDSQMSEMASQQSLDTENSFFSNEGSQIIGSNPQPATEQNLELYVSQLFEQKEGANNSQPDFYHTGNSYMQEKFMLLKKYIKENKYDDFVKVLEQFLNENSFDINFQCEYRISAIKGNKTERDIETTTKHTLLHVALKLKKLSFVKRLLELNADPTIAYLKNGTVMTSENDSYTGSRLYGDNRPEPIKKDITADKFAANHIPLLALLNVYGLVISTDAMNVKIREEFEMYRVLFLEEKIKDWFCKLRMTNLKISLLIWIKFISGNKQNNLSLQFNQYLRKLARNVNWKSLKKLQKQS